MSEILEYKCPACDGAMEFDSKSQNMKCPYCGTEISVQDYQKMIEEKMQAEETASSQDGGWYHENASQWGEEEASKLKKYVCQSCGGEIVAEEVTGASACPFCGNKVLMKQQFEGDLRPDYIIPFKKDKKDAKAAYFQHLKGKKFLPKVFKDQNHIDEIQGVYVPFWLYDMDVDADISYQAQQVRVSRSGNTEYTETKYFHVQRGGGIKFTGLPCDGSKKMDDALMESIEPFNQQEAVPFQPVYLAGYVADRYDVDETERMHRAKQRVENTAEQKFRETISGYSTVRKTGGTVNVKNAIYHYALFPVWILNTTWNGQKYTFAMNGQTGKMVGDLPADKKSFWMTVGIRGTIIAAIMYALLWAII